MNKNEINDFLKILIEEVRDNSIVQSDILINPRCGSVTSERLREIENNKSSREYAQALIPEVVDTVIFYILDSIDNGRLALQVKTDDDKIIDVSNDGELAGWYAGGEYIEKYSKQRYVDDLKDLEL